MSWWGMGISLVLGLLAFGLFFLVGGPASLLNVHTLPPPELTRGARRVGLWVFVLSLLVQVIYKGVW